MFDEIHLTPRTKCSSSSSVNFTYLKRDCSRSTFTGNETPKVSTMDSKNNDARTPKTKIIMSRTGSFNILPVINTPPRRFPKVFNPFDSALTDRLHMPIICR